MIRSRNYLLILLSLTLTGMLGIAVDCMEVIPTKNEPIKALSSEPLTEHEKVKEKVFMVSKDNITFVRQEEFIAVEAYFAGILVMVCINLGVNKE